MRRQLWGQLVFPVLFGWLAGGLAAQVKVHSFETLPTLRESAGPGVANVAAAIRMVSDTCNPGKVTRYGNNVDVDLNFGYASFTINNPETGKDDPVHLRSYGGCKAGPLIEVKPGNTLRVDLHNNLPADDPSCYPNPPVGLGLQGSPGVGCFNTMNLHTHGLHVSPSGNSDNVLLNIAPQTSFPYEINVPWDHPSGTFWYHAHRHGSTATQVASGAAGVLIVRGNRPYISPMSGREAVPGDIDTILHQRGGAPIPEKIFLFQQISYACFANDPAVAGGPWQQIHTTAGLYTANSSNSAPSGSAPWTCPDPVPNPDPAKYIGLGVIENFPLQLSSPTIWDTNGRFTTVNGVAEPDINDLKAGEIQRWRFLHGGIHDTINLQVVRMTPAASGANLIATSALTGNRQQQAATVSALCQANANTLIPQFEIASDGLTRERLQTLGSGKGTLGETGSNYLQPGYRSDILLVFPSEGNYCLLNQSAPPQERAENGKGGQGRSIPQLLAYVHVKGGQAVTGDLRDYVISHLVDANGNLPSDALAALRKGDLRPWDPNKRLAPAPATNVQTANFTINGSAAGVFFQINGNSYDPDVVNYTRQVNTTDEWLLTAGAATQSSQLGPNAQEPHIFHIHVNPFEVIDITTADPTSGNQVSIFDANGNCKQPPDNQGLVNQYCSLYHVFRDTLFVENGYQVHVRTRYDRYIGEFVIHCHILDHEDGGMMQNILIVPDLNAPGGGLGMPSMQHKH